MPLKWQKANLECCYINSKGLKNFRASGKKKSLWASLLREDLLTKATIISLGNAYYLPRQGMPVLPEGYKGQKRTVFCVLR